VLAGLSLLLLHPTQPGPVRRYLGAALAALLLVLGATSAFHYLTGADPAVGGLLFPAAIEADPAAPDPWPAPTSATAFLLSGAALLLLAVRAQHRIIIAQLLALGVGFLAVHALILYIYDIGVFLG